MISIFSRSRVPAVVGIYRRAVALPNLVNGVLVSAPEAGFEQHRRDDAASTRPPLGAAPQRQLRKLLHEVNQKTDDNESGQKILAWAATWSAKAREAALADDEVVGFQCRP